MAIEHESARGLEIQDYKWQDPYGSCVDCTWFEANLTPLPGCRLFGVEYSDIDDESVRGFFEQANG